MVQAGTDERPRKTGGVELSRGPPHDRGADRAKICSAVAPQQAGGAARNKQIAWLLCNYSGNIYMTVASPAGVALFQLERHAVLTRVREPFDEEVWDGDECWFDPPSHAR